MRDKCLDLIGKKFGKLTIMRVETYSHYQPKLLCKCDCGNEKIVLKSNLIRGFTKSCGCIRAKDNEFPHYKRLWNIWYSMKRRCSSPTDSSYKNYGAKGIEVCKEWDNDFMVFYKWAIQNGYKRIKGKSYNALTLDRIDNHKGYCPENCRWVDYKAQGFNKTTNRRFMFNDKNLTISEIAQQLGISYMTLYNALVGTNFTIEMAINKLKAKGKIQ